MDATLVAGSW